MQATLYVFRRKLFHGSATDFGLGIGGHGINADLCGRGRSTGNLVEVALGNHLAVAVEVGTKLHDKPADTEISADRATLL